MEAGKASVRDAYLAGLGPVKTGFAETREPRIETKQPRVIRYEVRRVSAVRGIWTEERVKERPGRWRT